MEKRISRIIALCWLLLAGTAAYSQPGGCFTPVFTADTSSVNCPEDLISWLTVDPGTTTGPFTYQWSTGDSTDTILNVPQQLLFVTITDTTGCTEAFSINPSFVPDWLLDAQLGSSGCANNSGSINLSVINGPSGPYSFLWSNGTTTEDLVGVAAGVYSVTVTSAQGCQFFENFNLSGGPPQPDLGPRSVTVCNVTRTLDAGPNFYAYQWNTGATTQTITVSADGTYYVNVWDSSGCLGHDTISLTFLTPAQIAIAGPNPWNMCIGDTAHLDAINSTIFAYQWNTGATSGDIFVTTSGTYSVIGTAGNGCTDTASVQVIVNALPNVSLGPDTAYCRTNTIDVTPGSFYANYLWSTGETTTTIAIGIQGGYWVQVTDSNGCVANDTIMIGENPLPTTYIGTDTTYCVGNIVTLDAGPGFTGYNWNGTDFTQTIVPSQSGPYQVVVRDSNGCYGASNTILVTILPLPTIPTITAQGSNLVSTPAATYQWYFEGNPIPGATNQTYTPTEPGNYYVEVTDSNNCGTAYSPEFQMIFQITNQHVPEGFSPNGDGIHDALVIKYIEFFPDNVFTVFNRWGQVVYSTFQYNNQWNGVAQDGKALPDGTYFYELKFPDHSMEPVSGYFIINR